MRNETIRLEPGSDAVVTLCELNLIMTKARKLAPCMSREDLAEGLNALAALARVAPALLEMLNHPPVPVSDDHGLTGAQRYFLRQLRPGVGGRLAFSCHSEAEFRIAGQLVHAGFGITMADGDRPWRANGGPVVRFLANEQGARAHRALMREPERVRVGPLQCDTR